MCEFSKRYPQLLLVLHVYGEYNEDWYRLYFHRGQTLERYAEITFKPYSKFDLAPPDPERFPPIKATKAKINHLEREN
jgi:hypothetical protein